MFPIKYSLSKEAMESFAAKCEHGLDRYCSEPLCSCGTALNKAILKASENFAKGNKPSN